MEAFTAPSSLLYLREWKPEQQEHTASDGLGLAEAGNGQSRGAWNEKTRVFKYKTYFYLKFLALVTCPWDKLKSAKLEAGNLREFFLRTHIYYL